MNIKNKKTIVIKIGTTSLIDEGKLSQTLLHSLAEKIKQHQNTHNFVIVTSGAVSLGGMELNYKTRPKSMKKLQRGMIDIPRNIIHKYLNSHVESLFLDLHSEEWDTSILLPVEDFVMTSRRNRSQFPYDRELVWEEMKEKENDRVKAKAIVKDY